MPFFAKMLLASTALVAASGLDARPQLPHCECLETWPDSDDITKWGLTYGVGKYLPNGDANDIILQGIFKGQWGMGVPFPSAEEPWPAAHTWKGCLDISSLYPLTKFFEHPYGNNNWQVCVPDVPEGGCVGLGTYVSTAQAFVMQCGSKTDVKGKNPVLNDLQLRAADMFEASLGEFAPGGKAAANPKCECSTTMNATFASTYCGPNRPTGEVDNSTCMAPQSFDNNPLDDQKTIGAVTSILSTPDEKWCEIPSAACSQSGSAYKDPCSGKPWMRLPNTYEASGRADNRIFQKQAFESIMLDNVIPVGAYHPPNCCSEWSQYFPLTFVPGITRALGYESTSYAAWDAAFAASATKNAKYEAVELSEADADQKKLLADKAAEDKAAKAVIAQKQFDDCEKDPKCKALQDAQKCSALKAASLVSFSKPCVLETKKFAGIAGDCPATCGTLTQAVTTYATGSGTCSPGTYACKPGDGACTESKDGKPCLSNTDCGGCICELQQDATRHRHRRLLFANVLAGKCRCIQ